MTQTIHLALEGLTCGHCVQHVKDALEQRDDVQRADVSLNAATVLGSVDAKALIQVIEEAGYHAEVAA